jgi:hypothetical protein
MHANDYLEHPGLFLGLFWAFWLVVASGASVLCIPLAFFSKSALYAYRMSRIILCGTPPLVGLYFAAKIFDPGDSIDSLLAVTISFAPATLALVAFVKSRAKCGNQSTQN